MEHILEIWLKEQRLGIAIGAIIHDALSSGVSEPELQKSVVMPADHGDMTPTSA